MEIIEKADLAIVDSIQQCKDREEIACSIGDGNLNLDNVAELGDVLSGKISGRKYESQITVSDLTRFTVQDIKIANSVFKKFMENKNEI
jgi:ornithine cyclodeaminase